MHYAAWLFGLGLAFVLAERLWPRFDRPLWRRGLATDLAYVVFNGEYLGVLLGASAAWLAAKFDPLMSFAVIAGWPKWAQLAAVFIIFDFAQWCVHNLMHRVPVLWRFHKVHHSIEVLDWIGNWRFHWVEAVTYRVLMYPVAALLGASGWALFWNGVIATALGHFAHANVRWSVGPLRYIINNPEMHAWHHAHPDSGPPDRNFGLSLSVWDWIFGTAHVPDHAPARLGFTGVENYPIDPVRQMIVPVTRG